MTENPEQIESATGGLIRHGRGFTEPLTVADMVLWTDQDGRTWAAPLGTAVPDGDGPPPAAWVPATEWERAAAKPKSPWTVPATIRRVVDGDTLDVDLDLGWHLSHHVKIRLAGVNAPELEPKGASGPGRAAFIFAEHLLWDDAGSQPGEGGSTGAYYPITVTSHQLDKYGRTLASVTWRDRRGVLHNLALELMAAGHAVGA